MRTNEIVNGVSYDLSQAFRTLKEIQCLIEALGNPDVLTDSKHLDNPGGFWLYTFEPWLESDLEKNRRAVNEAIGRLRPGRVLPGFPPDGPLAGE